MNASVNVFRKASFIAGLVIVLFQGTLLAQTYTWSTFAGYNGGSGNADGTGSGARFNLPQGVAVDGSGNVYVADAQNHTIRKITSSGVVTTLAGNAGIAGSTDGTGSSARFNGPTSVAVDGSGNVYAADTSNNTIRKITSSGVVTTLAGSAGQPGSTDGTGSSAQFLLPQGVAVDGSGNVYVADTNNRTIRKITSGGVVTTLAGSAGQAGSTDGTGSSARFSIPRGVAVDGSGNVYVADTSNRTIRKITSGGVVTTLAGSAGQAGSTDGIGSAARFSSPYGVAVDGSGNVYVADYANNTVRKITSSGVVTTQAGSAGQIGSTDGTGSAARFSSPYGVAVDGSGNVYVGDSNNNTIRKITSSGVVTTLAGSADGYGSADGTDSSARFASPQGVAMDGSGNIFVADSNNSTIRKITSSGVVTTQAGSAGQAGSTDGTGSAARFSYPYGVAVEGSGNVYVAEYYSTIRKITSSGVVTTLAGSADQRGSTDGTGSTARFNNPNGVAVDGSGNVYVADTINHTIRKITSSGVVTTLAGSAGLPGSTNGTGSTARFNNPYGVAVDGSGNVYVADTNNSTIRKITSSGVVTTLAGSAGQAGSTDGTGSAARFSGPQGVAVDGSGNVYVADTGYNTIRKITSSGVVTSIGGTSGVIGGGDGAGAAAAFKSPIGITVDSAGNLYVADSGNNAIRKGSLTSSVPVITSAGTASGTYGTAFSYTITASNLPTSYNALGLPAGLFLDSLTGIISGTPLQAGTSAVTITATNAAGTGTATLTITIAKNNATVTLGNLTATYDGTAKAASATSAPSGLTVNLTYNGSSTAPSAVGSYTVVATINDTNYQGSATGTLVISYSTAYTWSTPVGASGASGNADGTGSSARFNQPYGAAVDGNGNAYVADTYNHTIRKITSSGVVSTFAGSAGSSGSTDGTGSAARFNLPNGLAVDGSGNVYVADQYNQTIRKITSSGVVTTLAGSAPIIGSVNGTGNTARFNNPLGVAVDGSGNIYVADGSNHAIRKITSGGVVTTLAGSLLQPGSTDGTGSAARFNFPYGVAVDASGNVYVSDVGNNTVRKITSAGVVTTLAGAVGQTGSTDGTGSAARFVSPYGVAVDGSGNVYVTDIGNNTIRKITSSGVVTTIGGIAGFIGDADGVGTLATFSGPAGITVDSVGNLYVTDASSHVIRKAIPPYSTPIISSSSQVSGASGSVFTYSIVASNSPTSYSATGLPSGLTLNTSTGVISGTPTAFGTFTVTVGATNALGTTTSTLTLNISGSNPVGEDIPTLPEWGLILMATLLFFTMSRSLPKSENS